MSFTWFADAPLHTREEFMATFIQVADELDMPDKEGAAVCAGMCALQEAGSDPHDTGEHHIWTPGNYADPRFAETPSAFAHDSISDDSRSVGPFQQQTSGPPPATQWGWGGHYGDPTGTAMRMDMYDSTEMFMAAMKRNGYDATNAESAGRSVQNTQRSSFPFAYTKWWDEANRLYQAVAGTQGDDVAEWTGDPVWLETVLRPALGSRLKTLPGWKTRGHGDFKDIRGVMWHHTGNSNESAQSIARGRPDLAGPLSNIHIAPDGTVTIVAVGVCWHAGIGSYPWLPTNQANHHMIGVECAWPDRAFDGSYDRAQRWPDAQIISMRDVAAALTLKLGHPFWRNIGHKDWAGSSQGKWDPGNLDMGWFRNEIAKDMRGEIDPVAPPPVKPIPPPTLPPAENPRTDRELLVDTWEQLRGPDGRGWEQLGWLTVVDALSKAHMKLNAIMKRLDMEEELNAITEGEDYRSNSEDVDMLAPVAEETPGKDD